MPFPQSEHIVKSQLCLPSFHKKAAGVKQEYHSKQSYDDTSQLQYHGNRTSAVKVQHVRVIRQACYYIKHHYRSYTGKDVGSIYFSVFSYIGQCQPCKQSSLHCLSPPFSASLTLLASMPASTIVRVSEILENISSSVHVPL